MEEIKSDFKKKVNIEKAYNNSKISFIIICMSLCTYILPLIFGEIDFGCILEIISLVLLIVARWFMQKDNEDVSKIFIILSMIPVVSILIYDLISFIYYAEDTIGSYLEYGFYYYIGEFLLYTYVISLFKVVKNLMKADDPKKYKESTDWFYEDEEINTKQ